MRLGIIDIGTVTTRLLICDVDPSGRETTLCKRAIITHLGEGLRETGRLSPTAMERVVGAVRGYKHEMERLAPIDQRILVATSASRDASNSDEFADLLAAEGFQLNVIPGDEEARLSFLGAASAFPNMRGPILVVDVGGGSTEVVLGTIEDGHAHIICRHSFDVGCRRMTDAFLESDPPSEAQMDASRREVRDRFAPFIAALPQRPAQVIAVAGTATSLIAIREEMAVYDSARVHGSVMSVQQLDAICARLAALPLAEREQVLGLQPDRAGVIVAGTLILQVLFVLLGMGAFTVSESDILDGLALDAAR